MTALAMTPFVLMLGMKSNFISVITGVGHEKLNVLHRWLGYFLGFFSLVHAVPFIIEPLRNGGRARCGTLPQPHCLLERRGRAAVRVLSMFWESAVHP